PSDSTLGMAALSLAVALAAGTWWWCWLRPARPLDAEELRELARLADGDADTRAYLNACIDHHGELDRKDLDDVRMMIAERWSQEYEARSRARERRARIDLADSLRDKQGQ
ncbi:MAG: hypothetical protein ACTHOL_07715, partial [Luteibacter jiangsuensis]